jgi:hypothetical protein
MKLTAEGRPGPAGAQGTGTVLGADQYSIQTKKDESVLSDTFRFMVPKSALTPDGQHLGSYRYNEPLQQDVHDERNHPSTLNAFKQNPYTQPLSSF